MSAALSREQQVLGSMADRRVDVEAMAGVDLNVPNAARVYDFFLGGAHNTQVDREFAQRVLAELPSAKQICILNRHWLRRVVEYGIDQGVRQFLDLGSGIPTAGHVHEIAQRRAPDARVVYVDNEPVAVMHSESLLSRVPGAAIVSADANQPQDVFEHPETRRLLDFDQPVMVIMAALLHFVPDSEDPHGLIDRYADRLVPGSFLAISHDTGEQQGVEMLRAVSLYRHSSNPLYLRSRAEIESLFGQRFEILEPGVVFTPQWRPDNPRDVGEHPEHAAIYGAVGRKRS